MSEPSDEVASHAVDEIVAAAFGHEPEGVAKHLAILQAGVPYHSGTAAPIPHSVPTTLTSGLIVPQHAITSVFDYFGVYLTLDDYFPIEVPGLSDAQVHEAIIRVLLGLCDQATMLGVLGGLAAALVNEEVRSRYIHDFRAVLGAEMRARFDAAMGSGATPRVFLARQPLLAAFRLVLTKPPTTEPTNNLPPPLAAIFLVHAVASSLHDPKVESSAQPEIAGLPSPLAIDLVCNQEFHDSADIYAVLDRQVRLWRDYGPAGAEHLDGRQPADVFRELTGLEIEDSLALGFALYAHMGAWEPGKPIRAHEGFGSGMDEALKLAFLDIVASTPTAMGQALERPQRSLWDFLVFQENPVLHIDDGLIVVDAAFLLDRVTSGLYWIVHDRIKAAEGEQQRLRWTQAWGAMIEALAEDELRPQSPVTLDDTVTFFTEHDLAKVYPKSKSADTVIDFGLAFVAAEIVSGQLTTSTRIDGDLDAFAADMERLVYKKLRQLDATALNLIASPERLVGSREAFTTPVYPVVIAASGVPVSPVTTALILDYCKEKHLLEHASIKPVAIIDIGELEMIEGLLTRGLDLVTLLEGWQTSNLAHMSIRNYLLDRFPGDEQPFRPARMSGRVDDVFDDIRSRLRLIGDPDYGDDEHGTAAIG